MIAEKWEQIKDLFQQALELSPEQRQLFLAALNQEDPAIAEEVAHLLHSHEEAGDFLVQPCSLAPDFLEDLEAEHHRFSSGEVLCGRFRIVQLIGQGGMGEVYKAWDEDLEDYVALKTLRLETSRHELFTARFRREIQLARKVTHPNVCRIFDSFKHPVGDGTYISLLSMELLQGETLAEFLKSKGRLTVVEVLPIAQQIVAGLSAIHAAGIVHRDLKPSNLVLAQSGLAETNPRSANSEAAKNGAEQTAGDDKSFTIKITDFGIAGRLPEGPATGHTEVSKLMGTPDYMAPELLEHGRATVQSDIYSLGLILYEMVAGTKPFAGGSAWKRLYHRAPSPQKMSAEVDDKWKHTILCCLDRDPGKRPRSVDSVMTLLKTRPPRTRLVYAVLSTLLVLLIVSAGWKLRPHRPEPQAESAVDIARGAAANLSKEGFTKAIQEYTRARGLDPQWAIPAAELAYTYATASNARFIDGRTALYEARKAAKEAISLDPTLAKAQGALAWTQSLDFEEWPEAEETFRSAVRLDPSDGQIHYWFGVHLRKKGKFAEAEEEDRNALRLTHSADPNIWCELAFLYWTSGQIPQLHKLLQEQLKIFPTHGLTRFLNGRMLKLDGNYQEAEQELSFSQQLLMNPLTVLAEEVSLKKYEGDLNRARRDIKILEDYSKKGEVDGVLVAGDYVQLGDFDAAYKVLETAYQRKDNTLLSLETSPLLIQLHGDARFESLRRRLHFIH